MIEAILVFVLVSTATGLIALLVIIWKRGRTKVSAALRTAAIIHHALTAVELVALGLLLLVPEQALNLPAENNYAFSVLVFSGVFTSIVLLLCTLGIAAAANVMKGATARRILTVALWLITAGVVAVQMTAILNTW